MGHLVRVLMLLLFAAAATTHAAEVRPGDQVRLIERDQHIPASSAPDRSQLLFQGTYRQADKAVWDKLSDHCQLLVELWIR